MQSRISSEVRPSCSRLYPVPFWKRSSMENTQLLWATPWLSSWWKCLSLYLVPTSLVSICACCLSLPHPPLWRAWVHLPLPVGIGRLLVGPPKPSPPQAEQVQLPQPLLTQQVLHLGVPLLNLLHFTVFPKYNEHQLSLPMSVRLKKGIALDETVCQDIGEDGYLLMPASAPWTH